MLKPILRKFIYGPFEVFHKLSQNFYFKFHIVSFQEKLLNSSIFSYINP
jgi:hypothetical protein